MRTPKGSVKAYDKEGNFIGYVFKDWNDKISYEVRRRKRKESKEHNEKMMKMIMNGEVKDYRK
jgi:hypothetical protein